MVEVVEEESGRVAYFMADRWERHDMPTESGPS